MGQLFFQAGGSASFSSPLNGRSWASSLTSILSGSSPFGSLSIGSFSTLPLAVIFAWPLDPRMFLEHPTFGVYLQPAFQVANRVRQPFPGDLAPLGQVDLGVDRDQSLGAVVPIRGSGLRNTVA